MRWENILEFCARAQFWIQTRRFAFGFRTANFNGHEQFNRPPYLPLTNCQFQPSCSLPGRLGQAAVPGRQARPLHCSHPNQGENYCNAKVQTCLSIAANQSSHSFLVSSQISLESMIIKELPLLTNMCHKHLSTRLSSSAQ